MWSPYCWYYEIRGNANYDLKLPTAHVLDVLEQTGNLRRNGAQSFVNKQGFPWIDLTCIYTTDGDYGRSETLENAWCTLIIVRGSKASDADVQHNEALLKDIASALNWECILEEGDDSEDEVVLLANS